MGLKTFRADLVLRLLMRLDALFYKEVGSGAFNIVAPYSSKLVT